ncbi:MAG: hypothetical protein HY763_13360 [Planctomycetes bacterium]|nr:hypothetical protein [Planctomycetota bacterium]
MSTGKFDPIWTRARSDLVIVTAEGEEDVFLWEHSARLARSALVIAALAGVREQTPDALAILAAGLYHDAGWTLRFQEGAVSRGEILSRPLSAAHREPGVRLMEQALFGLVPPPSLERAAKAIRSLHDRALLTVEGRVLGDAENLEEFGLLSLWPAIRRGTHDGKGVQAVIDQWDRRREYQFWNARINEGFHFTQVRDVARRRLESYQRAIEELRHQHQGDDLAATPAGTNSARSLENASRS